MSLLHGKQIRSSSLILDKLSGTGSVVLQTGAIFQVPTVNIINPTDIVNKEYVDSISPTTSSGYVQYTISASENLTVGTNSQYWVYGDLTIAGQLVNYGEVIVANGNLITIGGGTYSNYGTIELVTLSSGSNVITRGPGIGGTGSNVKVILGTNSGLTFSSNLLVIDQNIAGNGLTFSSGMMDINTSNGITILNDSIQLNQDVAGTGLTFSSGVVNANVSNGLSILNNSIQLNQTVAGNGLTYSTGVININTSNGLTILNDSVQLNQTVAGNGLTFSSGVISVNTSNGLTTIGNSIQLNQTVAGNGLTYSSGILSVTSSNGIVILNDIVQLSHTIAGSGLTFSSGVLSLSGSNKFSGTYSLTSGVTQSVTHGLLTNDVLINIWDEITGELITMSVKKTSNNNIDIRSSVDVANVRVVISG